MWHNPKLNYREGYSCCPRLQVLRPMNASQLFKALGDDTRLNTVLLVLAEEELCVCELMYALQISQPKVSRHLALLRNIGVLVDRRKGQWVYYSISTQLPDWVLPLLQQAQVAQAESITEYQRLLKNMQDRPSCC